MVRSKAVEGCLITCGWHGMQGVRGSIPSTAPQQRRSVASQVMKVAGGHLARAGLSRLGRLARSSAGRRVDRSRIHSRTAKIEFQRRVGTQPSAC
jgi:hypothetical protein